MKKSFDNFIKDMNELIEKETGKTLDEIMKLPVDTDEEKKEFTEIINKVYNVIKDAFEDKPKHKKGKVKITIDSDEKYTKIEGVGSTVDVLYCLAQVIASILANDDNFKLNDEKFEEFGKMYMEQVKEIYNRLKGEGNNE